MAQKKKWDRKFLGKTEGFESKAEQRFEQKHLRAYIRGHETFTHGKKPVYNSSGVITDYQPAVHKVKQQLNQL